jgi:malonyl-CoA/methylmalonyl-CoA synthetase
MVVGVEDEEFGQRVGAVVSLRDNHGKSLSTHQKHKLLLNDLRKDLAGKLVGYKMPTLLRVWEGELPKGQTGKVLKRQLGPELFPPRGWKTCPEIQAWSNNKTSMRARL